MLRKQRELSCSAGNKSKQKPQQSQPQQHMPRQVCCSPFVGRTGCSCGRGSRSAAAPQNLLRSSGGVGGGTAPSWCSAAGREQIGQVRGGLQVQVFCATYCMRGKNRGLRVLELVSTSCIGLQEDGYVCCCRCPKGFLFI